MLSSLASISCWARVARPASYLGILRLYVSIRVELAASSSEIIFRVGWKSAIFAAGPLMVVVLADSLLHFPSRLIGIL